MRLLHAVSRLCDQIFVQMPRKHEQKRPVLSGDSILPTRQDAMMMSEMEVTAVFGGGVRRDVESSRGVPEIAGS